VVNVVPQDGLHNVYADPGQMEQLIMNLAANGRDAMPHGGRLQMETGNFEMDAEYVNSHPGARQGSYIRLSVRDTGEGMDAETRSHLFEPFFANGEPGKASIGLSTVFGIIKQNAGYIWVDSEPGLGTCVSVFIPRAGAEHTQKELPACRESASKGQRTLLVVEGFESLRKFICEFLGMADYRVLEARTGEEAIEIAAREGVVDLIICDVVLPGVSGLELAECVSGSHPDVRVLYIAGYAEDSALYPEWLQGSTQFIAAPFTPEEFSAKVADLLSEKKALAATASLSVVPQ
jgi:CheY-like chemotaxis protein